MQGLPDHAGNVEHGTANAAHPPAAGADALRSVHTTSFPALLDALGISLFVSTYQAGKLVVFRADRGVLNTHFQAMKKPMGIALRGPRLVLGTDCEIREFRNVPAVTKRLQPPDAHDACFLPRSTHVTGDIQVHDVAFAGRDVWFVNTSFSCLCTLDIDHSFVPRWRPPFVDALSPDDRCHLNGLAVANDRPAYVTALGETGEPRAWRDRKADGGVVVDVASNEVVARGLCMPHSPRWRDGRLWVLNSGMGGIGFVDLKTGRYEPVARVPGFTRGLDFAGRYAFIGLSQVRESAIFSGIPISDVPLGERSCGVWVVDVERGHIVAFAKFDGAVQEIFAVHVAPMRFPEIVVDPGDLIASSFVLPDEALTLVPSEARAI